MGSTHELDRTLAHALMAEFARVQLVMGKDLTQSLIALRLELENSSQAFLSDVSRVLNLQPTNPAAHKVKALLQRFHQALTIKVHLPLLELQAAPSRDRLSNRDPGTSGKARWEDDRSRQPGT